MCGRYIMPEAAAVERAFGLHNANWKFAPSYNVAPTQGLSPVSAASAPAISMARVSPSALRYPIEHALLHRRSAASAQNCKDNKVSLL